jgi:uncharacterized protein (DUF58 family)
MPLLSPELMKRLNNLTLRARRRGAGLRGGLRQSSQRGQSQEFADHRPYVPGDDLRFLDWHVYGRLDALWIKLFEEETDRVVQLLLDSSTSMEGAKLGYARQLSAALAWVALGGNDRVAVAGLSDTLAAYTPAKRGRSAAHATFRALEAVHPGGASEPEKAIDLYPRQRGAGIALLFTDFLYPQGPDAALKRLVARGNEVHAFHILSAEDIRPDLDGDLVLVDAETGEELALSVDEGVLDRYEATVLAWADEMALTCRKLGVGYTRVLTTDPPEQLILRTLRHQGLLS